MPNPVLKTLEQQVAATTDVEASAEVLISGFAARLEQAKADAIANGATEAELKPVQDEIDALKAHTDSLSAAVVANTPTPPATPSAKKKP